MRPLVALTICVLTGCADEGPFVEPSILHPTASLTREHVQGSFVLSLYLPPDASDGSEVHLHSLVSVTDVSAEVAFPVAIEPGELVRVPMTYIAASTCPITFSGTIHDALKGGTTPVAGPSIPCR